MNRKEASAAYKKLQKQRKKNKMTHEQFIEAVSTLRIQDEKGNWLQMNPEDGSWLYWDGSQWQPETQQVFSADPMLTDGENTTGLPPNGPQSLAQLFGMLFKGAVKNLPKMLIQAAVIGLLIWVTHAYMLVVLNNGYLKISSWAAEILALNFSGFSNVPKATFFWTMVGWLASYVLFTRILGKGPVNFFKDIIYTPGWVIRGFQKLGRRNIGIFLIVASIGLVINAFIENVYISGIIAIAFFLVLTSRCEGLMYLIIRLSHADFQRIFRKNNPKRAFNDGYLIALLTGIIIGVLVYLLLPYRPYSAYLGTAMLLAAGIFLMMKTRNPAITLLFGCYLGLNVYLLLTQGVTAHDGGFDEYGRDFGTWVRSEGRNEALAAGNAPAAGGMLGSLLGSLSNALSSAGSAVAQTARNTAQSIKDNVGYAVEVAVGTVKGIGQDFVEAGRTIKNAASSAWEGTKQLASDTAQAARDIYNNPSLIVDTLSLSAGQIKDGIVSTAQETAAIARDIWNDPRIVVDTVMGTGRDLANIASNIGNAIYTTVTDPKKAWEVAKEITGYNNFVNSWDPNRSLIERIGQVGIGTLKLYGTIVTAGKIGAAVKTGATKLGAATGIIKTSKTTSAMAVKTGKSTALSIKTGKTASIARPGDAKQIATFNNMKRAGVNKVDDFVSAIKSKDPARIREATLRIQGDPQAIANINGRNNFIKNQFNNQIQQVYRNTDQRVIQQLAREYNVRPDQIRVVSATNPNRSLTNVRVGFDRDITFRVGGKDVPAQKLQNIYNQEFTRVTGVKDPSRLGQTAVDRLHAEAYGRNPSDLQKVLSGQSHRVADSTQIGKTISYKAHHAFSEAAKTTNPQTALNHMFDGMRQTAKQWNNQVRSTIDYINSTAGPGKTVKVPARLQEAVRLMDQVNHGVSPVEITQRLRGLGMTPTDVATQAGDFFEAIMKLR